MTILILNDVFLGCPIPDSGRDLRPRGQPTPRRRMRSAGSFRRAIKESSFLSWIPNLLTSLHWNHLPNMSVWPKFPPGQVSVYPGNTKGGSIIDLLFYWFGLVCFANKNKNCQLSYSWFQISQKGGDTMVYLLEQVSMSIPQKDVGWSVLMTK